ncbi:FAD binding domain-containing protein [Mesorhizobium sp. CO1-1-8]|uniref:FAD binding domain-containing protein n=1 Tax=Mesorhizobium sp. CO1-1-8 TaxID=2876631 RepID=UPI001CD16CA2|nr:FAD binding domain-containing protein [Mesorhizobium sp. CO1-1-8]MBZ9772582.1 FAD binding domain-containing protein [Mesorhizobium sp. CO1-1-8]
MKPAPFGYERPRDLREAHQILRQSDGSAKIFAGGQSLGPMLNMRLAQPQRIMDITALPELTHREETKDSVFVGACVTHANIEDRLVPDASRGMMPSLATGIAYRAVRNRGTVGGSLCHADPAADWISILTALDAQVLISGEGGHRTLPISDFIMGVFEVDLSPTEILEGVRIPRLSARARWGYYKFCRKTGEFAEAIGVVVDDPENDVCRIVVGATEGAPYVLSSRTLFRSGDLTKLDTQHLFDLFDEKGMHDPYERQLHRVAVERAALRATA